jgi:hypothetical protein
MRRSHIIMGAALVAGVVALLGASTIITANVAKGTDAVPASASIDIMKMMQEAKDLPVEQFDAF